MMAQFFNTEGFVARLAVALCVKHVVQDSLTLNFQIHRGSPKISDTGLSSSVELSFPK